MVDFTVSNPELFLVYANKVTFNLESRKAAVIDHLVITFDLSNCSELKSALNAKLSKSFYNNLQKNLNNLSKNKKNIEHFEVVYKSWLDNSFNFGFSDTIVNQQAVPDKKRIF